MKLCRLRVRLTGFAANALLSAGRVSARVNEGSDLGLPASDVLALACCPPYGFLGSSNKSTKSPELASPPTAAAASPTSSGSSIRSTSPEWKLGRFFLLQHHSSSSSKQQSNNPAINRRYQSKPSSSLSEPSVAAFTGAAVNDPPTPPGTTVLRLAEDVTGIKVPEPPGTRVLRLEDDVTDVTPPGTRVPDGVVGGEGVAVGESVVVGEVVMAVGELVVVVEAGDNVPAAPGIRVLDEPDGETLVAMEGATVGELVTIEGDVVTGDCGDEPGNGVTGVSCGGIPNGA